MKNLKRKNVLLAIILPVVLTLPNVVNGQNSSYSKVLAGPDFRLQTFASTKENGFILIGNNEGSFLSINANANMLWSKRYDVTVNSEPEFLTNDLVVSFDSSIVVAGRGYNDALGTAGALVCKIKPTNGDTLWCRLFSPAGAAFMEACCVIQTLDSGYAICGVSRAWVNPSNSSFAAKLNKQGFIEWFKQYNIVSFPHITTSIKQTQDTGFIVTGFDRSNGSTVLYKLTKTGSVSWAKKYTCQKPETGRGMDVIINEAGYLCYIHTGDVALLQTDFSGNILWAKCFDKQFPGEPYYNIPYNPQHTRIRRTANKDYILTGGHDTARCIIRIDSACVPKWAKRLKLFATDIVELNDGSLVCIGGGATTDIGVIRTNSLGIGANCISPDTVTSYPVTFVASTITISATSGGVVSHNRPSSANQSFSTSIKCVQVDVGLKENEFARLNIFPNPTSGKIIIRTNSADEVLPLEFTIFSIAGSTVFSKTIPGNEPEAEINIDELPEGIYYFTASQKGHVFKRDKLILVH